ncbi:MAG: hypothetical protein JWO41_590 [Candidatus Saccharibacteria bacterium]|nr:hypothetical protein [Candidatus Saccharibacteria bacterium]
MVLGLAAGLLIAAVNRQGIYDYVALHGYRAPDVVSSIANEDSMTPRARKIFYVNHPLIVNKAGFGNDCTSGSSKERTIVLGCYHGNQAGIFVLEVNDARLTGVEQVTAAHEMLHAAYDRLSSREKTHINALLLDYYHNQLKDDRIKTTIDAYKQSEPDDVVNEMHSIFGTEIANLPAPLEAYYKQYFTDRSRVAAYADRYQEEFSSRTAAVKQYDSQLAALKIQIDNMNADLKQRYAAITSEQSQLASLRSNGNISEYNAGVPDFNRQVDAYNTEVNTVQGLVDQYNMIVASRNAIALEQQELANALSSSATKIK